MNKTRPTIALLSLLVLFGLLAFTPARTASAQVSDLIEMSASAGYDGYYRANQWMPLRVELVNNGDAISGTLIVRPETSGNALTNPYLTPVDLPTNSAQVITLYITARGSASELRVELLDSLDRVLASHDVALREVLPHDNLFVVLSGTTGGSVIDLAGVSTGGNQAYQATWATANIPDRRAPLDSVQAIVFNDLDTGVLTAPQRDALNDWVRRGGHLIVTGGANWQETAAGFVDVLPLSPENATEDSAMPQMARLGGDYASDLEGPFVVATGDLSDDASVLAASADGLPLVVRRAYGSGVIDFITVNPNAEPLRGWEQRSGLWLTLLTSAGTRPNWSYDFSNWEAATTAVEIMPGVDLFPAVLTLIGFLALYVVLVGPLNYAILNWFNRRELAWVTIPILIIVFTLLARAFGAELRGTDITLSRLSIVQTWPDSDEAQVDQLLGLLAPRRGDYTISADENALLRPIPEGAANVGVFGGNAQNTAPITQTARFEAQDFAVDASFIAGFNTAGEMPRPDIGGRVVLAYPPAEFEAERPDDPDYLPPVQTLQGSIRNDSDITLTDPVLLGRGMVVRLGESLAPGDLLTFNGEQLTLPGTTNPPSSALEYAIGEDELDFLVVTNISQGVRTNYLLRASETAQDILGEENYDRTGSPVAFGEDPAIQELRRRQFLLNSFVVDQYATTARGDSVYLVGWADAAPVDVSLGDASWTPVDTTLYIIELEVEIGPLPGGPVRIMQDQFTWFTTERENIGNAGSATLQLFSGDVVTYRFTPLPGAVLSEVEELVFILDQTTTTNGEIPVEFYDWEAGAWQPYAVLDDRTVIRQHERFLGPLNTVHVRVQRPEFGGATVFDVVAIEQVGTF